MGDGVDGSMTLGMQGTEVRSEASRVKGLKMIVRFFCGGGRLACPS